MARRGAAVTINNGQFISVKGTRRAQAMIAEIPNQITNRLSSIISGSALRLAEDIRKITPIGELDPHPGALRDSVHKEKGAHDLQAKVVVDAKDTKGRFYAAHVEYGHKTPDGGHVPAEPFFWPTVRLGKKGIRSAVARATRDAVKAAQQLNASGSDE